MNPERADVEKEAFTQEMIEAMASKGWRITEQRKTLAVLFAASEGFLSPRDVYEHMSRQYPGMSFDTVYRNLRLLAEMGVLEQVYLGEGLKFRARCRSHHHHHLICVKCERTVPFDFCPMGMMDRLPESFDVTHHRFEIFGYCADCRPEAGNAEP